MAHDAASSSTPKPATKPATKSMISGAEPGATAPADTGEGGTVGERAQEMRATLAVRRETESMLAEASELRQRAATDADAMVTEAEALATELVGEARSEAERLVAAAKERADGIVARARADADEMQESIEREREQLRAQVVDAVRADVERAHDGLHAVTPALETAISAVAGALSGLEVLREAEWTPGLVLEAVGPQTVSSSVVELVDPEHEDRERVLPPPGTAGEDGDDARPLGWLFRSTER